MTAADEDFTRSLMNAWLGLATDSHPGDHVTIAVSSARHRGTITQFARQCPPPVTITRITIDPSLGPIVAIRYPASRPVDT